MPCSVLPYCTLLIVLGGLPMRPQVALSARLREGQVTVVDDLRCEKYSTSSIMNILKVRPTSRKMSFMAWAGGLEFFVCGGSGSAHTPLPLEHVLSVVQQPTSLGLGSWTVLNGELVSFLSSSCRFGVMRSKLPWC